MPTISLRLTDEEHAALKEWAHGSRRSMQREAVYRIFTERTEGDAPSRAEREELVMPAEASAQRQVGAVPRTPVQPDPHFKPDFKR